MRYPVFEPYIGSEELMACKAALDSKYLGMGSFVGKFESALGEFLELGTDRHVVALSTGHAALHLTFLALNIGPGDEIITPALNNIADFQAISAVGAQPVFCDIDSKDLCIDPSKVEDLITDKTRAIITMDYGAKLADHEAFGRIRNETAIPIVHDAAHSFGSKYRSQHVGHQAGFTTLSFDPIKNLTCIDGGALVFEDESYVTKFREMRLIGMSQKIQDNYNNKRDWKYDVHRLGFRYHMPNLHAAIGLSQMKKFDEIKERRRTLYTTYHDRLKDNPLVETQGPLEADIVPFILCLRVSANHRRDLRRYLSDNGIETGIHWTPGHHFSLYSRCRSGDLSVTNRISGEIMSVPFYPNLKVEDVDFICDRICKYFEKT